jgi:hypothetical protein
MNNSDYHRKQFEKRNAKREMRGLGKGKVGGVLQALAYLLAHISNERFRNLELCDERGEAAAVHMLHYNPTENKVVREG